MSVFLFARSRAGIFDKFALKNTILTQLLADTTINYMQSPKEIIEAWFEAYNNRNADRLIGLYADDAEIVQTAFGDEPAHGREALLKDFKSFFTAFPDNYTNPENVFFDGEWAIIEWRGGGTFTGKLGDNEPTGKNFTLRGCGFFRIENGKIKFQRGYFDKHTWFSQIGLPTT